MKWSGGAGILHIETPTEHIALKGGTIHGIQLWVNLPRDMKWAKPRYQDIRGGNLTLITSHDGGALIRVISGDLAGHTGPGITHTPMTFVHATLSAGARLEIPWRRDYNALGYVLSGRGRAGREGSPIQMGQTALFGEGDALTISADVEQESRSPDLEVLVLGGLPIGEPVAWYGPFVMNTEDELRQAFADYRAGKMGAIPAAHYVPHTGN